MRLKPIVLCSLLMLTGAAATHCGSSDPPGGTSPTTTDAAGAYKGAMIGDGFAADLKLTIGGATQTQTVRTLANGDPVTVTGTLTSSTLGVPITLEGTFDPKSQTVTFRGSSPKGEISFSGKLENGVITGPPATTPFGPVPLVLLRELLDVRVYCGETAAPARGLVSAFTFGDRAGAAYALAGGPRDVLVTGTSRGGEISVEGNGARVVGTARSGTLTGTLTAPNGAVGAFTATEGRCATLVGALLDGGAEGGADAGSDGSVDAGPPNAPEKVLTVAAPGPGLIALANGTLYYAVNHTYFSQKLEVASVKTDGTGAAVVMPVNNPMTETRQVAQGLTVANGRVYVLGPSDPPGGSPSLYSVPTSGGAFTTLPLAGNPSFRDYSQSLASDATGLYRGECSSSGSNVRGYDFAGAAQGTLPSVTYSCLVVSDGTNVFSGTGTGVIRLPNTVATQTSAPSSTSIAANDTYQINGMNTLAYGMAVDATHVYWSASNNGVKLGAIFRKAKDGSGAVEKLTEVSGFVRGSLAVDDRFVWFTVLQVQGQTGATGTLMRIAKTAQNGAAQDVAPATTISVVSDGTYTYFASGNDLMKVRK